MAGLWKMFHNPKTGQTEPTFAIITGDPNEVLAPIHDRMAVILEPRDYEEYLADTERPPVHLLRTLPAEKMAARLISKDPITNKQASLFDSQ